MAIHVTSFLDISLALPKVLVPKMQLFQLLNEYTNVSIGEIDHSALMSSLILKKCFDTLNHDILINKLRLYGIVGVPLTLISNYLSNRTQSVRIGT